MTSGLDGDAHHQEMDETSAETVTINVGTKLGNITSRTHCFDCGDPIPESHRSSANGVRYCVGCKYHHDIRLGAWHNRRELNK